jgi:hypothetical protein
MSFRAAALKKVEQKLFTIALLTLHAGSSVRLLEPVWGHVCRGL